MKGDQLVAVGDMLPQRRQQFAQDKPSRNGRPATVRLDRPVAKFEKEFVVPRMTAAKITADAFQQRLLILKMSGEQCAKPMQLKFERGRSCVRNLVTALDDGIVIRIDCIMSDQEVPDGRFLLSISHTLGSQHDSTSGTWDRDDEPGTRAVRRMR